MSVTAICILFLVLGLLYVAYFIWAVFIYRAQKDAEKARLKELQMTQEIED